MEFGAFEVFLRVNAHADTLARRVSAPQDEAVMAPLLQTAQPERRRRFIADHQPQQIDVEFAARRQILDAMDDVARPRDGEGRLVHRGRKFHAAAPKPLM